MDQAGIKAVLHYCPDTGAITRVATGARAESYQRGYATVRFAGRNVKAHRLAWVYMTGDDAPGPIDHANRDRADNRWSNLRLSSASLNQQNRSDVPNKQGFPGVAWFPKNQKFGARIRHGGRRLYVGMYDTAEEASAAYQAKRRELFPHRC